MDQILNLRVAQYVLVGRHFERALLERMRQDKKARDGALTFILARGIGQAFVAQGVEAVTVLDFLRAEGAAT